MNNTTRSKIIIECDGTYSHHGGMAAGAVLKKIINEKEYVMDIIQERVEDNARSSETAEYYAVLRGLELIHQKIKDGLKPEHVMVYTDNQHVLTNILSPRKIKRIEHEPIINRILELRKQLFKLGIDNDLEYQRNEAHEIARAAARGETKDAKIKTLVAEHLEALEALNEPAVPLSVLRKDKKLTVFESLCMHLVNTGLRTADVARLTGRDPETVRTTVQHARGKLTGQIAPRKPRARTSKVNIPAPEVPEIKPAITEPKAEMPQDVTVFIDGACEPKNPGGVATYGFCIYGSSGKLYEESKVVGVGKGMSNNVAEYAALCAALDWLIKQGIMGKIMVKGDSQLVINQMQGLWQVKGGYYVPRHYEARKLAGNFHDIHYQWIPGESETGESNREADALSKKAYEEYCIANGRPIKYINRPVKQKPVQAEGDTCMTCKWMQRSGPHIGCFKGNIYREWLPKQFAMTDKCGEHARSTSACSQDPVSPGQTENKGSRAEN